MRRFHIAALTILGLVFTYLNPLQIDTASAANTVTKTITVKKSDGTPYAGALVSVTAFDPTYEQGVPLQIVTANSSGVAAITVPDYQDLEMLVVEPPAGDLTHGIFAKWQNFEVTANETIEAKLSLSNMVVNPKKSDGSAAGVGVWLGYISENDSVDGGSSAPLLRDGEVGITVNSGLNAGECYNLGIYNLNSSGGMSKEFGLKPSLSGSNYSAAGHTQNCLATLPSTTSGGKASYELKLASPNLMGSLRTASGQIQALPSGVNAKVILLEGQNGAPNYDSWLGSAKVDSSGNYEFYVEKPLIKKQIFASVQASGSNAIPSFMGSSMWMNTSGEFSATENGSYSTSPTFKFDQTIPASAANLKIKIAYSADLSAETGWINLYRTNPQPWAWFGPGYSSNGTAAFILEDGTYNLDFGPVNGSHIATNYRITVNGGVPVVASADGVNQLPDTAGQFTLLTKAPNLAVKIQLPDNPTKATTNGYFSVADDNYTNEYGANRYRDVYYANVPNGTYNLRVNANSNSYVEKVYSITISNQGIAISSDGVSYTATNGVFTLPVALPNIKLVAVDSSGNPLGQNGKNLVATLQKKESSGTYSYVDRKGVYNDNKVGFLNKTSGTYRIELSPNGDSNSATTYTPDFVIDASHQSFDLGTVSLITPPAKLRVRLPGSSVDLKWSYIYIEGTSISRDVDTGNDGVAAFDISTAGTYTIKVEPPYSNSGPIATSKTYTAVVTGTIGNLSVSITGATQNGSGDFILELDTPNITGKVLLPNGDSLATINRYSMASALQKYTNNGYWNYVGGKSVRQDGSFGFTSRDPGTYRVAFRPWQIPGAVNTYTDTFEITDANKLTFTKAFGDIRLAAPNAKFKVRTPNGSVDLQYASIQVNGIGTSMWDSMWTGEGALAEFNFDSAGTYELTVNPNDGSTTGDLLISNKYKVLVTQASAPGAFDVAVEGLTKDSTGAFVLRYGTPNLTGRVTDSAGSALPSNIGISISVQKFESTRQSWEWTDQSKWIQGSRKFGFNLTAAGKYRLRIDPSTNSSTYGLSFSQPLTVTSDQLPSLSLDLGDVRLSPPTLKGTLKSPDGTSLIASAQITAINSVTGQEMWEYTRYTNQSGQWSMTLPAGTFSLFARAPYGNSLYGDSEYLENISVDENGSATITGTNSQAIDLRLANPTWSGTVKLPGTSTTLMTNASVCMQASKVTNWTCTQTDSQGRWAISKPRGFTGFDASSRIIVYPNDSLYSQNDISGALAVTAALGTYVAGNTYANIVLRPLSPNTIVTVTAGGNTVSSVWVWAERNGTWIAGASTDANGVARLNLPNPTQDFNIRVDIQGKGSGSSLASTYGNARKTYASADITPVSGVFSTVVALPTNNFKAKIYSPAVDAGSQNTISKNSYIDIWNQSLNEWVGYINGGQTGEVATYLQKPTTGTYTYQMRVNPGYNPDSVQSGRNYEVQVSSNGTIVVTDKVTNQNLTATLGVYDIFVRNASVTGQVTQSDGITTVLDAWIEAMRIVQYQSKTSREWVEGANPRANGNFGLALSDGSYELKANPYSNIAGQTSSAKCSVQVTNGAVTTADSDCVTSGKVKLKLRAPNLVFKLANNGVALANTSVYVSAGNWSTYGNSDKDGTVSLFIDSAQIANETPSLTGSTPLYFNFYPPSNNSDVVRWNCKSGDAKPVCSDIPNVTIGQNYSTLNLATPYQATLPNTKFIVKDTSGVPVEWASVTLYKEMGGYRQWLGYGNTDAAGRASFNIENLVQSDHFSIEVNAPWNLRQTLPTTTFRNLAYSALNNQEFAFATPNLKLNIKQALGAGVAKWSYAHIQEVDSSTYNYIDWVGGYSADDVGETSMRLSNSKTYKITAYPGYKSAGTTTECFVAVDGSGVVSTVTAKCSAISSITNGVADFVLSAGNVVGRVVRPNGTSPVEGAIVFAEAHNAITDQVITGLTREVVTNANGDWGLQLDTAYTWKLKVFYVNLPTDVPQLASVTTPIVVTKNQLTSAGSSINVPVTLAAK